MVSSNEKRPHLSRNRMSRNDANHTLINLVKAFSSVSAPRERSTSELASEMSKRISQSEPLTFDAKWEPSELELWLREFDKLFDVVECPEELKVNHAAFYLVGEADYWWANSRSGLLEQAEGDFSWDLSKRAMREKLYPLHVRKDKSNEFARIEMGGMTVDEYYHKFMEYLKYCPDDVPTEEKKMQRFELGLSYDIQKHIQSDRYNNLEQMYKRASQIGNILRKEKEKEKGNVPEKRKEVSGQTSENLSGLYHKKARNFGNFQGGGCSTNSGFRGDAKHAKPLLDRDGNERKYFCRRCKRNHPGKDCDGNLIECNFCHKRGHREFECYIKKGRFQRPFNGGQGRVDGNRAEGSEMHRGGNHVGGINAQTASGRVSASKVEELNLGTFEQVSYTVAVPSGKLYSCDRLYKDVPLKIGKVVFSSDLYVLDMEGLEVILGMDWLGRYKATIECREQKVLFKGPRGENVRYRKFPKGPRTNLVSTLELQRLVRQGYPLYLCHISQGERRKRIPRILLY
ncbi:uncharacterized protein LOC130826500 [Amaranthus tricolor]|uniref:uncharacterized protein LOC130826500 n=1 Tax=Amaranthus tricolor TaxID=29722 RepID=UPI00258897B1|nr:uncharacterized protein LOC130826500 [Amaranthus tricolor]